MHFATSKLENHVHRRHELVTFFPVTEGTWSHTGIRIERVNPLLFPSISTPLLETTVVEIKEGEDENVPWLGALARAGFRYRSFSKYGASLSLLLQGVSS